MLFLDVRFEKRCTRTNKTTLKTYDKAGQSSKGRPASVYAYVRKNGLGAELLENGDVRIFNEKTSPSVVWYTVILSRGESSRFSRIVLFFTSHFPINMSLG